jgi:hypothetical protein
MVADRYIDPISVLIRYCQEFPKRITGPERSTQIPVVGCRAENRGSAR